MYPPLLEEPDELVLTVPDDVPDDPEPPEEPLEEDDVEDDVEDVSGVQVSPLKNIKHLNPVSQASPGPHGQPRDPVGHPAIPVVEEEPDPEVVVEIVPEEEVVEEEPDPEVVVETVPEEEVVVVETDPEELVVLVEPEDGGLTQTCPLHTRPLPH